MALRKTIPATSKRTSLQKRAVAIVKEPIEDSMQHERAAEACPYCESKDFVKRGMRDCALSIPLRVAEAHGMRFSDFDKATATLESAMQGCNKMIVYLEQANGLCHNADKDFMEDMSKRYMDTRGKMLRLLRSWQKFRSVQRVS